MLEGSPPEIDVLVDSVSVGIIEETMKLDGLQIDRLDSNTYRLQFEIGVGVHVSFLFYHDAVQCSKVAQLSFNHWTDSWSPSVSQIHSRNNNGSKLGMWCYQTRKFDSTTKKFMWTTRCTYLPWMLWVSFNDRGGKYPSYQPIILT